MKIFTPSVPQYSVSVYQTDLVALDLLPDLLGRKFLYFSFISFWF